jgi:hypothetical protein
VRRLRTRQAARQCIAPACHMGAPQGVRWAPAVTRWRARDVAWTAPPASVMAHPLLPAVLGRPEVFVAGKWVLPAGGATLPVINPATEAVVGAVGVATAVEVDAAVTAARAAFPAWAALGATGRGALLRQVAALVRDRKPLLAVCESADNGKPLDEAEWDMDDVATCFEVRPAPLHLSRTRGSGGCRGRRL